MNGWAGGLVDETMDGRKDGWMDRWMVGRKKNETGKLVDCATSRSIGRGWMDGRKDRQIQMLHDI